MCNIWFWLRDSDLARCWWSSISDLTVCSLSWSTADRPSVYVIWDAELDRFLLLSIGKLLFQNIKIYWLKLKLKYLSFAIHDKAPSPPPRCDEQKLNSRRWLKPKKNRTFRSSKLFGTRWKTLSGMVISIYFLSVNTIKHIKVDICFSSPDRKAHKSEELTD